MMSPTLFLVAAGWMAGAHPTHTAPGSHFVPAHAAALPVTNGCAGCNGCDFQGGCAGRCKHWRRRGCRAGLLRGRIAALLFWRRAACGCGVECGCGTMGRGHSGGGCAGGCRAMLPGAAPMLGPVVRYSTQEPPVPVQRIAFVPESSVATLLIEHPSGVRLFVDERPVDATGTRTTFHTPPLEPGATYFYDVRIELVRGGQAVTESRRVVLRAGAAAVASFPR